jgi:hypothetical protein
MKVFRGFDYYTISVIENNKIFKIFNIIFATDGSLYIDFPYYKYNAGILSVLIFPKGSRTVPSISLIPGGKTTLSKIKFAYHLSGEIHFSKSGLVDPIVNKKSIPLDKVNGHIFTAQFQGLRDFEFEDINVSPFSTKKGKEKALLKFDGLNSKDNAFKILGYWYSLSEFEKRKSGNVEGPTVDVVRDDGKIFKAFILATPEDSIITDYLLLIVIDKIPLIDNSNYSTLTFIGGFDPPEIVNNLDKDTNFLGLIYPIEDYEKLLKEIGSADNDKKLI